MSIFIWPVVIFAAFGILMFGAAWIQIRDNRQRRRAMARRAHPIYRQAWEEEIMRFYGAAYREPPAYGPFPADTGPLLIISEAMAANDALEREIQAMIEAAERIIGGLG